MEPRTNGSTIDQAEAAMRQLIAGKHPSQQPAASTAAAVGAAPREGGDEVYDLAQRVADTAKAMRDLADYSNNVAGDIERIIGMYIAHMHRLMGRLGK